MNLLPWPCSRLRRFFVFCVFAICVITAVAFWARRQPGADSRGALPAPPGLEVECEVTLSPALPRREHHPNGGRGVAHPGCGADRYSCPRTSGLRGCGRARPIIPLRGVGSAGIRWRHRLCRVPHGAYGGGSLTPAGQRAGQLSARASRNGFAAIADTDAGSWMATPAGSRCRTHAVDFLHLGAGGTGRER